jgi:hypothetical protein
MQNLNKFTKHELINKIKRIDNQNSNQNQSTLIKIVEYFLQFKSLILKITLIAFIIRWFRKYSLVQKLWHFFSLIGSSLLGISLIDIYSLDIISWIRELQVYKWFNGLLTTSKSEMNENISSRLNSNNPDPTGNEESSTMIERIKQIVHKEEVKVIEEPENSNTPFYKNKYFIITGIVITTCLSWYYFNEIKSGYFSSIDWIKSFWSTPPGDSSGSVTNNDQTPTRESVQERLNKYFKIIPKKGDDDNIELIDNTQQIASSSEITPSIDKGKAAEVRSSVLTSPSLEDLNTKAEEKWSEASSSSPKSEDSSSTITPDSFKESSSSNITPVVSEFITSNWKWCITNNFEDFKFIENTFSSEENLTKEKADKLLQSLSKIMVLYDDHITSFNRVRKFKTVHQIIGYKQTMYHFREWISNYYTKIVPLGDNRIEIGAMFDEPTSIVDN